MCIYIFTYCVCVCTCKSHTTQYIIFLQQEYKNRTSALRCLGFVQGVPLQTKPKGPTERLQQKLQKQCFRLSSLRSNTARYTYTRSSVLQCVAVCVLQCVAVCCSVLQCACCSVLQCVQYTYIHRVMSRIWTHPTYI